MEPGKIFLNAASNSAGQGQVIAQSAGNRLYRITNNGNGDGGSGTMQIEVRREVLWWTTVSSFDLVSGRSVDVYGSSISVLALDSLQILGSYDAD